MSFQAYKVYEEAGSLKGRFVSLREEDLGSGEVTVKVEFSSVNYKDALGATGKGKIFKKLPLIPGIDMAGKVLKSLNPSFKKGDSVLMTGCGLGEKRHGAYSERLRVPASELIPLPKTLSLKEAMIYGTAGFTAALCLQRLEQNGQRDIKGPLLVTGASGGVGQFALSFLSHWKKDLWAVSQKEEAHARLKALGVKNILSPEEVLQNEIRPLKSSFFGGLIDNVGGNLLSHLIPQIHPWGNVACVGLAGGFKLQTTVMPMILRGVSLLGISSTNCPKSLRENLWKKLATSLKPQNLENFLFQEIELKDLPEAFDAVLNRKVIGRILVKCS